MQRTKNKQPLLIATGDWHLREDKPIARIDDFWYAQWRKVVWITSLATQLKCPIIQAGDIFHHWKPSPYLLSTTMQYLQGENIKAIYGNHDLPQHSLTMAEKSGMFTLQEAGVIELLFGTHWGQTPGEDHILNMGGKRVCVWHVMTWLGETPWPGCTDLPADKLLDQYEDIDLLITGHNHKSFAIQRDGRWLVNPGSITRQTADQENHEPSVYVYYSDGSLEKKPIPMASNVITREHIERKEHRDDRIDAFVSRLDGEWQAGISFEENLERFISKNQIRQSVKEIIQKALDS